MDNSTVQSLIKIAIDAGATGAGVALVDQISFQREFRAACKQNGCGKYGTCWMCPPDVGDIDEMIAQAKTYKYALVFQSVAPLEDSFDIEGMEAAAIKHNALVRVLAEQLGDILDNPLKLGAGACHVCARCAKMDGGRSCVHPNQATASLEAYGIAVSALAEISGLAYINGSNTVTYFGGFLFR